LRIRFHFMEIRNWGYVAQSHRIANPLSFYGDPELGLCGAVTPDQLSFYGDPELELLSAVTQDCGSAFILWRSELGAVSWIRIGFNADLDPAFYFNEDLDPGSQTDADSCGSGS
jgi:hypothetical protein